MHIDMVLRQALDRLHAIHRGVGTLWGLHPMIVSRMIVAAVLAALFYAAPAWCGAVRHLTRLRPLDRVLQLFTHGVGRRCSHNLRVAFG